MQRSYRLTALAAATGVLIGGCAAWNLLEDPNAPASVAVEGGIAERESSPNAEYLAATDDEEPFAPVPRGAQPGSPTRDWTIHPVSVRASDDAQLASIGIDTVADEGFDRIEIEMRGDGTPGWDARYVLSAYDENLSRLIRVNGQHILQLRIAGTARPFDLGLAEFIGAPINDVGPALRHVIYRFVQDGTTTVFIGVDGPAPPPFRVFLEQEPLRIVIEIEDLNAPASELGESAAVE